MVDGCVCADKTCCCLQKLLPDCNLPTRIQKLAKIYLCSDEKVFCLLGSNLTEKCMSGRRRRMEEIPLYCDWDFGILKKIRARN